MKSVLLIIFIVFAGGIVKSLVAYNMSDKEFTVFAVIEDLLFFIIFFVIIMLVFYRRVVKEIFSSYKNKDT